MDELKTSFLEGLPVQINLLKTAKTALQEDHAGVIDSVLRVVHALKGPAVTSGFQEIVQSATGVEEATEETLETRLDELIKVLQSATSTHLQDLIRILIIDDDPDICFLLKRRFSGVNCEVITATSATDAERYIAEKDFSLIILDLVLQDMDGRNFLVNLKGRPATAAIPVIILSAKGGVLPKAECLALGAEEYIEKPFDPETLSAVVASRLKRASEISRESRRDLLTGLPNRAAFCEAFKRAQALAHRSKEPFSVAIIDLDQLRTVSDEHGHLMGDEVLKRLAGLISRTLREPDFSARWRDDEFAVFFPNTYRISAVRALERVLSIFQKETFQTAKGPSFHVTFSAGVVVCQENVAALEAVAEAERFLTLAKSKGGNQILFTDERIAPPLMKILLAEEDELVATLIKHRLARENFEVSHYYDGISALNAAASSNFSLFILDIKLPKMDGFELLSRLRSVPALKNTPIIILTPMGSDKDIMRSLDMGADDYILKPFTTTDFLARIHHVMKSS